MSEGEGSSSSSSSSSVPHHNARAELLKGPRKDEHKSVPLSAADKFEITELINTFVQCIDSGDKATFADLFTDDGVCEILKTSKTSRGHSALADLCAQLHQTFLSSTHWESNIVIRSGENHTAVNYSYWMSVKNNVIQATGSHHDIFIKDKTVTQSPSGAWKFLHRKIFHHPNTPSLPTSSASLLSSGSTLTPGAGPPSSSGEKETAPTEESEEPGGGEGEGKPRGKE